MAAAQRFAAGDKTADIAADLRVGVRQVEKWRSAFHHGGIEALRSKGPHTAERRAAGRPARTRARRTRFRRSAVDAEADRRADRAAVRHHLHRAGRVVSASPARGFMSGERAWIWTRRRISKDNLGARSCSTAPLPSGRTFFCVLRESAQ
jgi:hypothetical protein